jgi:hypothetical protein
MPIGAGGVAAAAVFFGACAADCACVNQVYVSYGASTHEGAPSSPDLVRHVRGESNYTNFYARVATFSGDGRKSQLETHTVDFVNCSHRAAHFRHVSFGDEQALTPRC